MKIKVFLLFLFCSSVLFAQENNWQAKFEQMDDLLTTPNQYRNGDGSPGPAYWQQQADYKIKVRLDDQKQKIEGEQVITYYNRSPNTLTYLWVQLDQNHRAPNNDDLLSRKTRLIDSIPAKIIASGLGTSGFEGGFNLQWVKDGRGKRLPYTINKTMMRIDLKQPLKSGEQFEFSMGWWYNINDRMSEGGRSGYEYFPEDGNYVYTIAQFYPRMAVYDDYEGWQHAQFLGRGEFALTFGNFEVAITLPDDHLVAATGVLQNEEKVLSKKQLKRLKQARKSFDKPVMIVTEEEAMEREKGQAKGSKTWLYKAENVRDFAFAASRKFIWDAQNVKLGKKEALAMSLYPKEGNPLWEKESTKAVVKTLKTFSDYTFDYPYPVATSVHTAAIGMEYPMICFNFGRPRPDGSYNDAIKYNMIGVVIHEVGHNFFPMIVNSDERKWTWMDEGLNTFLEYRTQAEQYDNFPASRGPATTIIPYMKSNKANIRPIMTGSEQLIQFGNNAYGKPATALEILRSVVLGDDLFRKAFRTYAQRWAFKHPKPSDFFRTMEDASGTDLDWFWRGWFYTVDHVDIALEEVKYYKVGPAPQSAMQSADPSEGQEETNGFGKPRYFTITETPENYYWEFVSRVDDQRIIDQLSNKHFYELHFRNEGGLIMPIILEFTMKSGKKERIQIPAEIWRYNEEKANKVFYFDEEVVQIEIDPDQLTADTDREDNAFPSTGPEKSRFEKFKEK